MAVIYIRIDSHTLLYSYQLYYILLYTDLPLTIPFPRFLSNVYLVFSVRSIVIAKMTNINKHQIELTLGFAFTEYKVQRATFKSTVLDL